MDPNKNATHNAPKGAHQEASKEATNATHDGKIVSMTGNHLVMKSNEGKECSHTLASDAKLTCDGVVCKAADMKVGLKIRVTTKAGDRSIATGIESLSKNPEFAACA